MAWYHRFLPSLPVPPSQGAPSVLSDTGRDGFPWPDPATHLQTLTAAGEQLRAQTATSGSHSSPNIYFPSGNLTLNGPVSPASQTTATDRVWQAEVWDLVNLTPPMSFLVHTLASRLGLARWFLASSPTIRGAFASSDPLHVTTQPPAPLPSSSPLYLDAQEILSRLGPDEEAWSESVEKIGVCLYVVGEAFIVPPTQFSHYYTVHSPSELWFDGDAYNPSVTVFYGQGRTHHFPSMAASGIVRVWNPNSQFSWLSHSPAKPLMPVMRKYIGLDMHTGAQIDSRLAGAGLLVYSQDIEDAARRQAGLDNDDSSSPFAQAFTETAMTAIKDRSSAAAIVPMLVSVPGETVRDKFEYLTFDKPFDEESVAKSKDAVHTIALGMDCPPELLEGASHSSHWSAWLTRDDVIASHLVPKLKLIANALTKALLVPALVERGHSQEEASSVLLWFTTDGMSLRPNRTEDAKILYDRHEISGAALRQAYGFAPKDAPEWASLPAEWQMAYQLVIRSPQLVSNPGLPNIVQAFKALLDKDEAALPEQVGVVQEVHRKEHETTDTLPSVRSSTQPSSESHNPARSDGPPESTPSLPAGRNARGDVAPDSREHPVSQSGTTPGPQRTPA